MERPLRVMLFSSNPKQEKRFRFFYFLLLTFLLLLLLLFWEPLRRTGFTYSLVTISIGNTFLRLFLQAITILGSEGFFLVLFSLIYWFYHKSLGFWGLIIIPFSIFISSEVPKDLIRLPRPDIRGVSVATYTFPSGHTSGAVCGFGYLAMILKKQWFWLSSLLIILLVGLSRIMLGYHYPGDVIGGLVMGMAFLYFFSYLGFTLLFREYIKPSDTILFIIAVIIPLCLSFLPVYYGPRLMGYLTGAGVGYLLEMKYLSFKAGSTWPICLLQGFIGLLVLGLIILGLEYLIRPQPNLFKYAQAALATGWITYLAPLLLFKGD